MSEEQRDLLGDESFSSDLLSHLDAIPPEVQKKWPRDLSALVDIYSAALERLGYNGTEAQKISHTLLAEQSVYCGGRYFYLPKLDALKKAIRDVELHRDWSERGVQPDELADKYKISATHVYRIIKEQQAYYRKRIQPELF
ncbi:Mor transcription activator family protein [uncultured Amphritea sp.]|uniref:Mor transcription activator family protein n=1 Tax=uncultured Amphritea sp. TaxID=981605 RepID=UPI00262B3D2A|nr:Mor transcription activator family protein [uncultured Amphritea sp.]